MSTASELPISKELLEILRCPLAVQEKEKYGDDPGKLQLVHNTWLVSNDSGLKYPIRDGIPIMLIDEGKKWANTPIADLPVPPPAHTPSATNVNTTTTALTKTDNTQKYAIMGAIAAVLLLLLLRRGKK